MRMHLRKKKHITVRSSLGQIKMAKNGKTPSTKQSARVFIRIKYCSSSVKKD